jgi:putrescine transport system substrate-binding protein
MRGLSLSWPERSRDPRIGTARMAASHVAASRLAAALAAARHGSIAGLGLALVLCGCGARHSAKPATEEPVLNIYNWAEYIGHDTIEEFEKQTHIKVVYALYDSNETLETALLAGTSGYDIVSTTTAFYGRQIQAKAYLPLDKSKLPNWRYLDPAVLAIQAQVDPGNRYAVPYLHAMNGFVYNEDMIKARMPNAPTDSLAMIFDPKVVAKFADCGVTFLDSPEDVMQLALAYLRRDPNSRRVEDLDAATRVVLAVRPFIRQFDSEDYWHQLAAKETCLAVAWSSDYSVAQLRAREDGTGAHLKFTLPKEGSNITYNAVLIPASAPHPEAAHRFLNFILEPKIIAQITNDIHYGNDNLAARPYVNPDILNDPAVYPSPELRARLYLPIELGPDYDRLRTRAWTRIKTGQ